mgnify:CR=1 FL=1
MEEDVFPASWKNISEEETFKTKYEQQVKESKELRETVRKLSEKVLLMEKELAEARSKTAENNLSLRSGKSAQKKRRIEDWMRNKLTNEESEDLTVNKELENLKKKNENLIQRIHEREKALEDYHQQCIAAEESDKRSKRENELLIKELGRSFEEKFNNMETKLMDLINHKTSIESSSKSKLTFASAVTGVDTSIQNRMPHQTVNKQNFKEIMMSTRNEEIMEERDRKQRINNIIIHGKEENSEKKDDITFVKKLIQVCECDTVEVKNISRIGNASENKKRPIKIELHNEHEKEQIMNNLQKLKNRDDFKGVSITNDYTLSERQLIREFVSQAKAKSLQEPEESNYVWRV